MAFGTLREHKPVVLGAGELYIGTVQNVETATAEVIDAALENVGAIESGATLKYTPTMKTIESGNRGTIAKFVSKEEVIFNCGVMTWLIDNLAKLAPVQVKTDAAKKTKTISIGGKGSLPVNYLRFVHTKEDGKTITINMAQAVSEGGFELKFDKENPMVINYEFSALSKIDGTLVEIIEEFETIV